MSNSFMHHPASYRDPSGFIFIKEAVLYRQVNQNFKEHFDHFISSGCYESLVKKNLLLPHEIINENLTGSGEWYLTLKPEHIPFISYAYEWSFNMLKDAALLTLQLLKEVMGYGLVLKDATPYNIQWHQGKFIFIDTLSFEKYNEQEPWIAYRQFCEGFLSPLLLMHYSRIQLQQLQLAYPDGIPLAVTSSLLPGRSKYSLHTYLHIHLHARISSKNLSNSKQSTNFSKQKLLNLVASLESLIIRLKPPEQKSAWSEYYNEASQRKDYLQHKKEIIQHWVENLPDIKTAIDLGANDGAFSKLLAAKGINVLTADFDAGCINNLYNDIKKTGEINIQPLVVDLSNPSPATGVNNEERSSFIDRCPVDLVMGLALLHHLAIGKNIPFPLIADLFQRIGKTLIIEFIPKEDEKIKGMLKDKRDIYNNYTEENFTSAFSRYFIIQKKQPVGNSGRILYLMEKHI